MLFAQYLGGSVASAAVNMMQPFQITMPWLSQFGGMRKAGAMARALKDMSRKGFQYEPDLAAAMQSAEGGWCGVPAGDPSADVAGTRHWVAPARATERRWATHRAAVANNWERVKVAWGQPFALAEQFNRRSTFIAAYPDGEGAGHGRAFQLRPQGGAGDAVRVLESE